VRPVQRQQQFSLFLAGGLDDDIAVVARPHQVKIAAWRREGLRRPLEPGPLHIGGDH
jgi:hypothetical protein